MAARLARLLENFYLVSGGEQAQCSLWFLSPSGAAISTLATVVQPLMDAKWLTQKPLHSPSTGTQGGRVEEVDINTGHLVTAIDIAPPAASAGTGPSPSLPSEVTPVLTLRTGFLGARFRGRIYLPCPSSAQLAPNGGLLTTTQTSFVGAYKTFLSAINTSATDWTAVVYSRVGVSTSPIVSIDMGGIYDVQRRRRNRLAEPRVTDTITP